MYSVSFDIVDKDEKLYAVTLQYTSDAFTFFISPEYPLAFKDVADDLSKGEFKGTESNGTFHFKWDHESATFTVGKFGDGKGGDMKITVKQDEKSFASLKEALKKWRDTIKA